MYSDYRNPYTPVENNILRKATLFDYLLWFDDYTSQGGRSFSVYNDRSFDAWGMLYSEGNYTIECGCGAKAKDVIVSPRSVVSFSNPSGPFGGHGHCTTFVWGGELMGSHPGAYVFNDFEFLPYIEKYGIPIPAIDAGCEGDWC